MTPITNTINVIELIVVISCILASAVGINNVLVALEEMRSLAYEKDTREYDLLSTIQRWSIIINTCRLLMSLPLFCIGVALMIVPQSSEPNPTYQFLMYMLVTVCVSLSLLSAFQYWQNVETNEKIRQLRFGDERRRLNDAEKQERS